MRYSSDKEGILAHENIQVKLVKDMEQIRKTLVLIGSHDLILDVINDLMMKKDGIHVFLQPMWVQWPG